MSYWCGFGPEDINMTSNVAGMWRLAGADLAAMEGQPASQVLVALASAVRNMLCEPAKYRALEPDNGWGDYEGCVGYLVRLAMLAGSQEDGSTPFYVSH